MSPPVRLAVSSRFLRQLLALALSAGATVTQAAPPARDVGQILACMRANVPDRVQVQRVELVRHERDGGTRTLSGRLHAQRDTGRAGAPLRALLQLEAPAYLAGASYLLREQAGADEALYVYLPSVRRVRRISGEFVDGALLGTDISYYEFRLLQQALADAQPQLEGEGALLGRPAHLLSATPAAGVGTRVRSLRAWIDHQTCVPLQIELADESGVYKRLSAEPAGLRRSDSGGWYASRLWVQDLRGRTRTELRVLGVDTDAETPSRRFDPARFHLAP